MRGKAAAVSRAEEQRERVSQPYELRHVRGPRGAGDAEAEAEDEFLVEHRVGCGSDDADQQRGARPADAVEEAEHGPHRGAYPGTNDAREPELRGGELHPRIRA